MILDSMQITLILSNYIPVNSIRSKYASLYKLAPFSSCEVERVFSQYELIKTEIMNSLATRN